MPTRTSHCPSCHTPYDVDDHTSRVHSPTCATTYRLRPHTTPHHADEESASIPDSRVATQDTPRNPAPTITPPRAEPAASKPARVRRVTNYRDDDGIPIPSTTSDAASPRESSTSAARPSDPPNCPPPTSDQPKPDHPRRKPKRPRRDDTIEDDDAWLIPGIYR